jgi:lipoate-protein ligase A
MIDGEKKKGQWRLLPTLKDSGSSQMALDQALLEEAVLEEFKPTMRFQRWSPPALSIGRFQDISDIELDTCAESGIEVVRRPTGGKCILHLGDFTYSLVFPAHLLPGNIVDAYSEICAGIVGALKRLGLEVSIQYRNKGDYKGCGGACFAVGTEADLGYGGRKVCGSSQVRKNGAILQHGSILMKDHSDFFFGFLRYGDEQERKRSLNIYKKNCIHLNDTGRDYSWHDLAESFPLGFEETFGVNLEEGRLSVSEEARWRYLAKAYASPLWLQNAVFKGFPAEEGLIVR